MTYAVDLLASLEGESPAYLQFITGRGREGFRAYAFVEDSDDIVFYQHVLHGSDNISFIGCGGKTGVIALYLKAVAEGIADGELFFCDRDTEAEPFRYPEILRTSYYSWESHLCQVRVVSQILQKKSRPNLTRSETEQIQDAWSETIANFALIIAVHTALVEISSTCSPRLDVANVPLVHGFDVQALVLSPGGSVLQALDGKKIAALHAGITASHLLFRQQFYEAKNPLVVGRGKNLLHLFRAFAMNARDVLSRKWIIDLSNTLFVLASVSPDCSDFDYIRDYVSVRLGLTQDLAQQT